MMFVVCFLGAPFIVKAADIEALDILEFGILEAQLIGKGEAPEAATGTSNIITRIVFIEQTTNIPAQAGIRFGFEFIIKGKALGDKVDLTYRYLHPPMTNPETGKLFTSQEIVSKGREIGKADSISYSLDYPWEAVPGEWVLQVLYKDRKVAEKSFNLYKP